jgi:hypothetical protein
LTRKVIDSPKISIVDTVNDTAVKRLLRLDKITGKQIGRILFLNVCEMVEGRKQLYSAKEYSALLEKIADSSDKEIFDFLFYQKLATYATNELNEIIIRDDLSLKGLKYNYTSFKLYKLGQKINIDEIQNTVFDVRLNLQYINSYALFYDAVKKMLGDRRLKPEYRIPTQSRNVINQAKKYDDYLTKEFTESELKKLKLNFIGEIPRIYTEHPASKKTIDEIIKFLKNQYDPKISNGDSITTSITATYLNRMFPRD